MENKIQSLIKIMEQEDIIDERIIKEISDLLMIISANPQYTNEINNKLRQLNQMYSETKVSDTKLITVNWNALMYASARWDSCFGSYCSNYYNENHYLLAPGKNFLQLYKDDNGLLHIKYQPTQLLKNIHKTDKRKGEIFQYLELVLLDKDLCNLDVDKDTIFMTETNQDLLETIKKADECNSGKDLKMPKIMIPLRNKKINDKDVGFIKILLEYISYNKELSNKVLLNITNSFETLDIKELITLYQLFSANGFNDIAYNYYDEYESDNFIYNKDFIRPISANIKMIKEADRQDQSGMIYINSRKCLLKNSSTLNLYINGGISNERNITNLFNFMCSHEANNIEQLQQKLGQLSADEKTLSKRKN